MNMSIILGRPFLNTAGVAIDRNQGKVIFNVDDKEHTVYFSKKINRNYGPNTINNIETIQIGKFHFPLPIPRKDDHIVMVGTIPLKIEVT
jgi:hypothetical protein